MVNQPESGYEYSVIATLIITSVVTTVAMSMVARETKLSWSASGRRVVETEWWTFDSH